MPARRLPYVLAIGAVMTGAMVVAQIEGGSRGVAPVASSGSFEVSGVRVDVSGKTAEAARYGGWRLAQRRAWAQLSQRLGGGGGAVSDATLDGMVSGIIVEDEQIGPNRYIARLGVLFNRARAGSLLGIATYEDRSSPMLVIPVIWSAGVGQVFEQRTAWQEAWARFRTGNSAIDYVRPAGTGPDALLLNVGQTERVDRPWWRTIVDQYGASDVLIPTVRLYRQWPGGPVIGVFQARHGPDNRLLGSFTLRVGSAGGLPQLLDAGVRRIDAMYQAAQRTGELRPDYTLSAPPTPTPTPTIGAEEAATLAEALGDVGTTGTAVSVQFDTPTAAAVAATETAMRGVPGVRRALTTSLALGGVSLMQVTYDGDPEALKAALEVRGYQVLGSGAAIRVRRAPQLVPADVSGGAPAG